MAKVQPEGANHDLRSDLKQPSHFASKFMAHTAVFVNANDLSPHGGSTIQSCFFSHGKKRNIKGCCFNLMDTVFASTSDLIPFIFNSLLKKASISNCHSQWS